MGLRANTLGRLGRLALAGGLVLAMTACVATYRNHGYVPPEEELAKIQVGRDTRESVAETIGTPGASGVLNTGGYYYIESRVRHYGARAPQTISRELVAISFDSRGRVSNIERFGLERGRVIPLERRITDSGASDRSFLRQLLSNLGNFSPGQLISD
ncbi:MAG: outer membrane protein assembly factor BamE [Pseudooceanicola sp.]|nr:outer membrane protein assembly factor BamE [Pseudooceanicola sp.]